jgi:SNF2 family DNA or RNA helicase
VIDKFNKNPEPCLLFVGITAGGKGLCIEQANKIIIYEPLWNPDVCNLLLSVVH